MSELLEALEEDLEQLESAGLRRQLRVAEGLDVCSNDYLGLSGHPALARAAGSVERAGAPASRLLRGQTREHERLEARFAAWKGTESALLLPSGYQANLGLLTGLVGPRDRVLSDRLNHASLIDGLRLTGCRRQIFAHRDVDQVAELMAQPWPGRTFLLTESLFSMDGDLAPLDRYAELVQQHAKRQRAYLLVDDAHGTGLFGDQRRSGLVEHFGVEEACLAVTATGGKSLGLSGGFICASEVVIRALVQRCRPLIFSTAVPPLLVAALSAALDLAIREDWRASKALEMAADLRRRLRRAGLDCRGEVGPIVPVVLGSNDRALAVAAALQRRGYDVRAIRPPTVPPGEARLRLSIHADHQAEELMALADALVDAVGDATGEAPRAGEVTAEVLTP